MARVCLLVFIVGLQLGIPGASAEITEDNTETVFISQQTAHAVLKRQRRYNSGRLEEVLQKANLERECREEQCTMEEAREWFENDEKTMEFWVIYTDDDQCEPKPCQNGGVCRDEVGSYSCYCQEDFRGKNCEIYMPRRCSVNNGGCAHFCTTERRRPVCYCAAGYKVGADGKSCEPTGPFSCGIVSLSSGLATRSFRWTQSSNSTNSTSEEFDYDYFKEIEDYLNSPMNESELFNSSAGSVLKVRSVGLDSSSSLNQAETIDSRAELGDSKSPRQNRFWDYVEVPTVVAQKNEDERIVGGNEATPGEIPWQVGLMAFLPKLNKTLPICGGSLLSEFWVITAAHCLVLAKQKEYTIFVRVGEHDVNVVEASERNHEVAEEHIHHRYDFSQSQFNHDIALLKLATPVELSNERRPICVGSTVFMQDLMKESGISLVSGWGRTLDKGREADKLQKLSAPVADLALCKQSSRNRITRFMFCAGLADGLGDSCHGDSGGPHATNYKGTWFLTGIVSWGEGCAEKGKYGIYTHVSRYYAWIVQKTGILQSN
ncbi:coagulation factor VII-like [Poecilia latipinna]|uniref:coagulation factor VII-like n=1 Tax=Poecilia latipinna TaxID=48699 RepID=UPI00072DC85A|nr:PREDICTED: coagulation factor VII-like [Poecilia latipinna]XP_014878329.1 PREDICTED: coagulation factor VII-like [Poecilia latipinna]XP_014878333.1 PREDICTED: coagulation factor VII-like [Poecilia latipinna]XP_014878342.1 PREDICTED: coagulation factor VII-like [Poecilia latipinna]